MDEQRKGAPHEHAHGVSVVPSRHFLVEFGEWNDPHRTLFVIARFAPSVRPRWRMRDLNSDVLPAPPSFPFPFPETIDDVRVEHDVLLLRSVAVWSPRVSHEVRGMSSATLQAAVVRRR